MRKIHLQFSNWKVDDQNQLLYKLSSKVVKNEVVEKLEKHLKFSNSGEIKRYLANYENCHEDVIVRAIKDSLESEVV